MKAVILAGNVGTVMFPLANYYHKLSLPLANKSLISYLFSSLIKNGIKDVAIISCSHLKGNKFLQNSLNANKNKLNVTFFEEKNAKGTAGTLKDIQGFVGSSDFAVINSDVFIEKLDFKDIFLVHKNQKAAITILVGQYNERPQYIENIEIDKHNNVIQSHILHHSSCNRRNYRSCGIYIFSPSVLDLIPDSGYMDIKEQLIPFLQNKGLIVHAYKLKTPLKRINDISDYFQVHRDVLLNHLSNKSIVSYSKKKIMDRVWVGKNVKISGNAYLLGPLVIGDHCVIEDNSQIIGPSTIGNGSHIGKNVLVRESILWERTRIKNDSKIEYSFIGMDSVISKKSSIRNMIVIDDKVHPGSFNFISLTNDHSIIMKKEMTSSFLAKTLMFQAFKGTKRVIDLVLSFLGLLFFLPFFFFVAIAIKLDSPGNILYIKKRCGLEGKKFFLVKFRTMVRDAEKIQRQLFDKKDVDGPMFKMENDPRITRVGNFLRKTSIDEIPQLFNVLKGEMSLVGPRPLIMEEMKFSPSWRDIRLKVKPGITGLWQINGRSNVSFHDWIKYDIAYVKKQSLMLDLKIIIKTFRVALSGIGAK